MEHLDMLRKLIGFIDSDKKVDYKDILGTMPQCKEFVEQIDDLDYYYKRRLFLATLRIMLAHEADAFIHKYPEDTQLRHALEKLKMGAYNLLTKNVNFKNGHYKEHRADFMSAQKLWSELLLEDLVDVQACMVKELNVL